METERDKTTVTAMGSQPECHKAHTTSKYAQLVHHESSSCSQNLESRTEAVCCEIGGVSGNPHSKLECSHCSVKLKSSTELPLFAKSKPIYSENVETDVTLDSLSLGAQSFSCSDPTESCDPSDTEARNSTSCAEDNENDAMESTNKDPSPYDNPIFRELSRINGEINKLKMDQLKARLRSLHLDTHGKKSVLQKRLKTYYKVQKLQEENIEDPGFRQLYYDNYVIIDFEATCDNTDPHNYRHEIIEFPGVLVCTKSCRVISEFHSYVRPSVNPKLTSFCTSLTGITQDKVNFAPMFPEVLQKFEDWLSKNKLTTKPHKFAIVTDGPWDMGRFLYQQCLMSKIPFPSWAVKWINIRKNYSNFYSTKRMCLKEMLRRLGMNFEGQPHCGLDDSRNIARVAIKLLKDGANLRVNERIHLRKDGSYNSRARVYNISRHNFSGMKKKLLPKDKCDDVGDECEDESGTDPEDVKPWVDPTDKDEFPDLMPKPRIMLHR